MFSSETFIRVRYAETDQMGYVYYGNYPTYYEVARVETMRKLGYSYQTMEEEGIMMPVIHVESIYKRAAHYDDLLIFLTIIKEITAARMTFFYEIYNDKKVLLHTGSTT
ncbi:MAG: thioesterase family protein, partial [Bacteroidales bacterium]